MAFAAELQAAVPAAVWEAAHHRAGAVPLIMSLLIDREPRVREHQFALLEARFGRLLVGETRQLTAAVMPLSHSVRLSLLDLAFPALREMNVPRREFLLETVERMVEVDGQVDAFEAAVAGALRSRVLDLEPDRNPKPPSADGATDAALKVLAALAIEGHHDRDAASRAFDAGVAALGNPDAHRSYRAAGIATAGRRNPGSTDPARRAAASVQAGTGAGAGDGRGQRRPLQQS